ncbi:MAG: hypothetical protein MJZ13_09730 [Bacteroidales bacterium]|nr:hypothetical protein [Bacteroidales bacterium]
MKKTLLIAVGVLSSVMGFAQYMPDSTVQICAYWNKGEKMSYECSRKQIRKTKTGGELTVSSSKETMVIDVLDATEKSYVIQLGYKDILDLNAEVNVSNVLINKLSENLKIRVKTNELGTLEEILDMDNTISQLKQQTITLIDDMYSKSEEVQKAMTREQVMAMIENFCTKELLVGACLDDISPLVMYHGGKYEIGEEYAVDVNYNVANVPLQGKMTFWVDPEESDSTFAVIRSYTLIDGEDVLNVSKNLMLTSIQSIKPDADVQEVEKMIDAAIKEYNMTDRFEQYTTSIVHVDSGWTTNWYFDRIVTINEGDGETQIIDKRTIEMLELE